MFIKKRGKAKAKAAAEGGGAGGHEKDDKGAAFLMTEDDFDHRLGNYQLMEPIGKGGYGTVYRGLNIERGMTVAVKRVNLQGIPSEELEGIEMEIRLLQNLAHPNIVKYLDSIRSDEYLNIILEFVENGSLSSLLVKFGGMFPEQLCAHYITQVLKGLNYLHTQGVIHRDIKGANILSTKEGVVKLADFGVATKLNESRKSDSVVGTPYWMAPEIIEMTGQQSSACDIWSVGCTAIELLTGKPPYFDLQQMPALFRIVQDEHPPLPDGISPALEDFLMLCFAKDPNRRIDAVGLLKHPWLKKSVEMQEGEELKRKALIDQLAGPSSIAAGAGGKDKHGSESDEEEDEDLKRPKAGKKPTAATTKKPAPAKHAAGGDSDNEDWDAPTEEIDEDLDNLANIPVLQRRPSHKAHAKSTAAFPVDKTRMAAAVKAANKQSGTGKPKKVVEEDDEDEGELTIKIRAPAEDDADAFADFSDEEDADTAMNALDEEDEDAEEVIEKTSMKTIRPTPQITPAALAALKPVNASATATNAGTNNVNNDKLLPSQINSTSSHNNNNLPPSNSNTLTSQSSFLLSNGPSTNGSGASNTLLPGGPKQLESFVENDEDELGEYEDLEEDLEIKVAVEKPTQTKESNVGGAAGAPAVKNNNFVGSHPSNNGTLHASSHATLSNARTSVAGAGDELDDLEDDEVDPFDDITFEENDQTQEDVLLNRSFHKIIEQLSPQAEERVILEACEKLHEMGAKNPEQIRNLMTSHGVIPIMELLEVTNPHILHAVLKVVNQIVGRNLKFQQNMSLVGLIPAIIRFGGSGYPTEIRMESASFVRQFCYATDWTRKMFIACDGLPVLVSFMREDYHSSKTLVWNAIDCIAESTLVNLATGQSVPIEQVQVGQWILARSSKKDAQGNTIHGLEPRQVTSVDFKGDRECLELQFSDGRKLECTSEHRILLQSGKWATAGSLIPGVSEVAVALDYAASAAASADASATTLLKLDNLPSDWTTAMNALGHSHPTIEHAMALSRMMGVLVSLSPANVPTSAHSILIPLTHAIDVTTLTTDLALLGCSELPQPSNSLSVAVPIRLVRLVHSLSSSSSFPTILLSPSCPLSLVQEFLGALFGAAGRFIHHRSGGELMLTLSDPLARQHVQELLSERFSIAVSQPRVDSSDTLLLSSSVSELFLRTIGFRHACEKHLPFTTSSKKSPQSPPLLSSTLPLHGVQLLSSRPTGKRRVWDLSVPSGHDDFDSFTANGIVVHNCVRHVFDINTSPKNDFCRLFCKFGLLEPLSRTLLAIQSDTVSIDAPEYVLKCAKILHLFSQGDKVVKKQFAHPAVIESMLKALPSLPQDILILLLKSIRNISMENTTLDLLESAGAIPALIPFLDASQVSENQHQVLLTMYYLCQIKSSRQEQAAMSGIIPHLQRFIRLDHPLKQFAYPIIFLLAKTSWRSRLELKKHGGLQFYIDILVSQDVYWRSYALEIIAFWVCASQEDAARVSFVLNTSSNINKLLRVFRETSDEAQFDKMGNSMKKLLQSSPTVNQSMGRLKEFIREIKERLDRHAASNNIRLTLLRILSLMVSTHANPPQLIADAVGLEELIHKLYEEKSAVIVSDMAQKILEKLKLRPTQQSP